MRELVLAILALVLWLESLSYASGQDRPLPEVMVHPRTGEEGMWIPLWLEQQHLVDEEKHAQCRRELDALEELLLVREEEVAALREAFNEQSIATDEALKIPPDLPAKTWPLWTVLAVSAASLAVAAIGLVR
jgi:hypothetical protein